MNSLETSSSVGVGQRLAEVTAAAAVGYALGAGIEIIKAKRANKYSMLPYCADLVDVMSKHGCKYALVGGLPIDAFNHPESEIDVENRRIYVNRNFKADLIRGNGTRRDLDIFFFTAEKIDEDPKTSSKLIKTDLSEATKARAETLNSPAPVISVFPFDAKPSLVHTATILNDDGSITLKHGFAETTLPEDAMQIWELVLSDGKSVKILDPWEQYWRSMTRFSSGIKLKDQEKLGKMLTRLRGTPGLAERENDEINSRYSAYNLAMLRGNSRRALNEAYDDPERDWLKVANIGTHVLASRIMDEGQNSAFITWFVQSTPDIFDNFVGA